MKDAKLNSVVNEGDVIVPDAVFDGKRLRGGVGLRIHSDTISLVEETDLNRCVRVEGILSPGFFDIQVNGGGGVLLNADPTVEGLAKIAAAHRLTGTTRFLPTVITDRPEVTSAAANAVIRAKSRFGICGIHIEGPHISLARRGTHKSDFVRKLDQQTFDLVSRLRTNGIPTMMTVAPEAVLPGQITALVGRGVVVALGHSDATADQTNAALLEGAQTFTHLYNAMSPMTNREPGVTGAAIASEAYCSVICDGIHVSPTMLRIAMRAKPKKDRIILVTDAMPTVGGPDSYSLYGQTIFLKDGRLVNAEGALAGAHVTMLQSIAFTVQQLEQTPEASLRMAITNPARLMGMERDVQIERTSPKDLILIGRGWDKLSFPFC